MENQTKEIRLHFQLHKETKVADKVEPRTTAKPKFAVSKIRAVAEQS